jgi:hypothetical protein
LPNRDLAGRLVVAVAADMAAAADIVAAPVEIAPISGERPTAK